MPAFLVKIPDSVPARTLFNGANAVICSATDAAAAKVIAAAQFDGDSNALWNAADVTEIEELVDMEGVVVTVVVTDGETDTEASATGAAEDTFEDLMDALVIALNATTPITTAAWDNGTLTLTVAAGATDALGDNTVAVTITLPSGLSAASAVSTITDGGVESADLTVLFIPGNLPGSVFPVKG